MGEPISESKCADLAFYAGDKSCCELVSRFETRLKICKVFQWGLYPDLVYTVIASVD